ncbi:hypothetical protein [Paraburkholderia hospita]|uniref:hypothetical protein n=1 Tax=Paraburkholderia hospita TaxID=169430 RepID=UPI000B348030|nr:hypothetical protein [Paraburkholderia hospita]OUL79890.1 hypothetical protein CA603_32950 [Paraburkholderia hospita]
MTTRTTEKWTPEQDAILADMYRHGHVSRQLDRLPGRTHRACIQRALRIGASLPAPSTFTELEDRIIRRAYRKGTPIKEILALLPGRSQRSVHARAQRLRLNGKFKGTTGSTYSWIEQAARDVLDDSAPLTAREIAALGGASISGVVHMLRRVHGNGFYIAAWEHCGNSFAAKWLVGNEPDMPKPVARTNAENCRRRRARARLDGSPFKTAILQVTA